MAKYTLEQIVNLPKEDYGNEELKIFDEYLEEGYKLYSYLGTYTNQGTRIDYFAVINPEKSLQIARYVESQAKFTYLEMLRNGTYRAKGK